MGTSLVDACKDPLTKTSARTKLSDINELWSDTLVFLDTRQDNLEQAISHAAKYESLRDQFAQWLAGYEARLASIPKSEDDPAAIVGQLSELEVSNRSCWWGMAPYKYEDRLTMYVVGWHIIACTQLMHTR